MRFGVVVLVVCTLSSCLAKGPLVWVRNTPAEPAPHVDRVRAGATEVDITPPPGLPTYGFSSAGAPYSEGYWLRLRGRIIVLESGTTRIAMMQLDLGAASPMLHRKIAERTQVLGIAAPQLVMSTTHTHGGPAALYSDMFFNGLVGARPLFDEQLVEWMADQLANGVKTALSNMKNARLAWGQTQVADEASSNRSRDAWLNNFADGRVPGSDVDRTMTMLRVDLEDDEGKTKPLAAWTVFAVHGNSIGPARSEEPKSYLFHGDVHGLSARLTAHKIRTREQLTTDFVAATTTGAEGDVTPGPLPGGPQGVALTTMVSGHIADAADSLHASLAGAIAAAGSARVPIAVVYDEASMRGANTTEGRLCPSAFLGGPQMRGSEEGRGVPGWAAPILRTDEGTIDPPHGCTATKVYALGKLQEIAVMAEDFPDVGSFQLVTFGEPANGLALAGVPGEPTTEVGRMVKRAIARERWGGTVAVLGLTNAYMLYITTGPEYVIQDYEGGGTIYGGHEGTFVAEEFGRLAARWKAGQVVTGGFELKRAFRPGATTELLPRNAQCDLAPWSAGKLEDLRPRAVFHWTGASPEENCPLPAISIKCDQEVLSGAGGFPQTDQGFTFEVRRSGARDWSASWEVNGHSDAPCRFVVDAGARQLESKAFNLKGGKP